MVARKHQKYSFYQFNTVQQAHLFHQTLSLLYKYSNKDTLNCNYEGLRIEHLSVLQTYSHQNQRFYNLFLRTIVLHSHTLQVTIDLIS